MFGKHLILALTPTAAQTPTGQATGLATSEVLQATVLASVMCLQATCGRGSGSAETAHKVQHIASENTTARAMTTAAVPARTRETASER